MDKNLLSSKIMSYLFDDIKEGKNRKSAPIKNSNIIATKEQTKVNITTIKNLSKIQQDIDIKRKKKIIIVKSENVSE